MSKDPKGTGGSNPLCSTNESVRTAGPFRVFLKAKSEPKRGVAPYDDDSGQWHRRSFVK
jgi:hypothetical protein